MTIREALLAMGYRECKSGYWLKPIGYQLFSYHEGKNEWANWLRVLSGEIDSYDRKSFQHDEVQFGTYLRQLKEFECWTATDKYVDGRSQFELGAIDI
jgi:hypothetical protein